MTSRVNRGGLRSAFLYYYHRFPGYLQAKRERATAKLKQTRWQLDDSWQRAFHGSEDLTGKSREQVRKVLFRDLAEHRAPHQTSPVLVESYKEFNVYSLEGRFFGLPKDAGNLDVELLRDNKYAWCSVGHTVPDIEQDIDQFLAQRDGSSAGVKATPRERALFISNVAAERAGAFLDRLRQYDVTVLVTRESAESWPGYPTIDYLDAAGGRADSIDLSNTSPELLQDLKAKNFDLVIAPYEGRKYWNTFNLEVFVPAFANRLMVMFEDGKTRFYKGEDLNRITYNKAYLNDMFRFVPPLKGRRVLEVGCSDGLACDLLLSEDPAALVGVDCMEAVGCNYRDPKINYFNMDAANLQFKDGAFDVCYSLATLEHVPDPFAVMAEMKRVTRKGGYCIVQAGPLYHSPFGHHMFGFFDDYPWIHLRLSKDEIAKHAEENQIEARIRQSHGISARDYVDGMLRPEHINGLKVEEYRLDEFMSLPDVKVLNFARNYEGENLLDQSMLSELPNLSKENLTTSGFELIFKVK
jgi:SAM-dependent methyltransferase